MKSAYWFSVVLIAGMVIHYFIEVWWFPFAWCAMASFIFSRQISKKELIAFGIYSTGTASVLYFTSLVGSRELIQMIGDVFKGLSFAQLNMISTFIVGTTASLGAALGSQLCMAK